MRQNDQGEGIQSTSGVDDSRCARFGLPNERDASLPQTYSNINGNDVTEVKFAIESGDLSPLLEI